MRVVSVIGALSLVFIASLWTSSAFSDALRKKRTQCYHEGKAWPRGSICKYDCDLVLFRCKRKRCSGGGIWLTELGCSLANCSEPDC